MEYARAVFPRSLYEAKKRFFRSKLKMSKSGCRCFLFSIRGYFLPSKNAKGILLPNSSSAIQRKVI
jgi:hypothetical protein